MLKKVEISTLVILIIFAFYCALTIGSSWDESYEMTLGKERLKYLFSFGSYKNYEFYRYEEFYPEFYNTLANVKSCFEKVKGEDLVTVERNGLMLSKMRKKL